MTKQIVVRGVDLHLWRHFRADAIAHQMTTGELLNHVLAEWRKTLPDGPYIVRVRADERSSAEGTR